MKIILDHLSIKFKKMYYVFIDSSPWWSSCSDSALPLQGSWVRSLVGELGSRMLHDTAKKKKKKESSVNSSAFPSLFWALCGADSLFCEQVYFCYHCKDHIHFILFYFILFFLNFGFIYLFVYLFIYLFIFGCVRSSFLCEGFL